MTPRFGLLAALLLTLLPALSPAAPVDRLLNGMSDEKKAGQLLLVYHTSADFARKHGFGGVLVMQNMLKKPQKLRAGLANLQKQNIGVIVAIDQEGGLVNRMKPLPGWKKVASAETMSGWSNEKITALAEKMGKELKRQGINMNLAPVLDPSHDHTGRLAFMGQKQRAFGKAPERIAEKAGAYIIGFENQGIAAVSKHFPGYDVLTNSDHEIAVSKAPMKALRRNVKSFERLSGKVEGVMISSIHFESVNGKPAVLSPRMLEWARQIHPDAILMTDDLWGEALRSWIRGHGKKGKTAEVLGLTKLALDAGNDMLMITHPQLAVKMKKQIAVWMRQDPAFRGKVEKAVRRILNAKRRMGLL